MSRLNDAKDRSRQTSRFNSIEGGEAKGSKMLPLRQSPSYLKFGRTKKNPHSCSNMKYLRLCMWTLKTIVDTFTGLIDC